MRASSQAALLSIPILVAGVVGLGNTRDVEQLIGDALCVRSPMPAGLRVEVRLLEDVDSATATVGDVVRAEVVATVVAGDRLLVAGTPVRATVFSVKPSSQPGRTHVIVRFECVEDSAGRVPLAGTLTATTSEENEQAAIREAEATSRRPSPIVVSRTGDEALLVTGMSVVAHTDQEDEG